MQCQACNKALWHEKHLIASCFLWNWEVSHIDVSPATAHRAFGFLVAVRACVQFVLAQCSQPLSVGKGTSPGRPHCLPTWPSHDSSLRPFLVALNHDVMSPPPPGVCVHRCLWSLVLHTRVGSYSWAFIVLVTCSLDPSGALFGHHAWMLPAGPRGHRGWEGREAEDSGQTSTSYAFCPTPTWCLDSVCSYMTGARGCLIT